MKKVLVGISVVAIALVIFGAGFYFAQSQLVSASGLAQGFGPGGMMGGRGGQGQIYEYVEQALADKLGMTKADIETQETAGKSLYQITLDKGTKEADMTTLMTEVHKTALAKAVTDGILTQAQSDTMLKNLAANGFNTANCNMQGRPEGGHGGRGHGFGGMMGNWNQQPAVTVTPAP